jgi:hypothetical protein
MIYQLANGKVIHLSIEEYLQLTDDDMKLLISANAGETILNPFQGSVLEDNVKGKVEYIDDLDDYSIEDIPDDAYSLDDESSLSDFLNEYDLDPEN